MTFPVTDAQAIVDARRTLADVTFPMQDAARGSAAAPLAADFGHDAGVAGEEAALLFVPADPSVDGLAAWDLPTLDGEQSDDLLGAESLPKVEVNFLENRFWDV